MYLLAICLFWRNVYLGLLLILFIGLLGFFDIELHVLFVYFGLIDTATVEISMKVP